METSKLEFMVAVRICRNAKLVFARPVDWPKEGRAIDLGAKLDKRGRIMVVEPIGEASYHYEPWHPNASDFIQKWVLVSEARLLQEVSKDAKSDPALVAKVSNPKEAYGLELKD